MKSLRDEIRLTAEEKDGFDFIHAVDFICAADFILAPARISLYHDAEVIHHVRKQACRPVNRFCCKNTEIGRRDKGTPFSDKSIGAQRDLYRCQYPRGKICPQPPRLYFIAKLQIAPKECYETEYWIEISEKAGIISADSAKSIMHDCGNIRRMLISSINTAKENGSKLG